MTAAALIRRALVDTAGEAVQAARMGLRGLGEAVRAPRQALREAGATLRAAAGLAEELTMRRAPSPLHERRSLSRRLSTFEMSLGEITAAGQHLGATVNDVVLAIVSGAMHRWHTSRGADVRELRAIVPVNLRPAGDMTAGNRLALLALRLPIGEPNPVRRLRLIQRRMGRVKADRRAALYPVAARLVMALPLEVAAFIGRQQTRRANFVCTNVPGPRRTCYLAGEPIEKLYPYAPLVGDHPVAIALCSYRDVLYGGLDTDPLAMPDLARFRDGLREAYEEMIAVARDAETPRRRRTSRPSRRRV